MAGPTTLGAFPAVIVDGIRSIKEGGCAYLTWIDEQGRTNKRKRIDYSPSLAGQEGSAILAIAREAKWTPGWGTLRIHKKDEHGGYDDNVSGLLYLPEAPADDDDDDDDDGDAEAGATELIAGLSSVVNTGLALVTGAKELLALWRDLKTSEAIRATAGQNQNPAPEENTAPDNGVDGEKQS